MLARQNLRAWSRALSIKAGSAGGGILHKHRPAASARPTAVCQLSAYSLSGHTLAASPCVRQPKLSRFTACVAAQEKLSRFLDVVCRVGRSNTHHRKGKDKQQAAGERQDAAAHADARHSVHTGHRPSQHLRPAPVLIRPASVTSICIQGEAGAGRACMARSVPSLTTGDSFFAARSPATWWKWLRGPFPPQQQLQCTAATAIGAVRRVSKQARRAPAK